MYVHATLTTRNISQTNPLGPRAKLITFYCNHNFIGLNQTISMEMITPLVLDLTSSQKFTNVLCLSLTVKNVVPNVAECKKK